MSRVVSYLLTAAFLLYARRGLAADLDYDRAQIWRAGDDVRALAPAPDGRLWIGTAAGLLRFDGRDFKTVDEDLLGPRRPISALLVAKDGALWAGTEKPTTLVRLFGGQVRQWGASQGLAAMRVRALAEDNQGTLWIACDSGMFTLTADRISRAPALADPQLQVLALGAGTGGDTWVGTNMGLHRMRRGQLEKVADVGRVNAVVQVEDKGALLGLPTGLWRWDVVAPLLQNLLGRARLPARSVSALTIDRTGGLWIGTALGIVHVPPRRPFRPLSVDAQQVSSIGAVRDGSVWILNGDSTIVHVRGTEPIDTVQVKAAPSGLVNLLVDDQGAVWIGSWNDGLFRYQDKKLSRPPVPGWTAEDTIRPLLSSSRQGLVLAMGGGQIVALHDGKADWHDFRPLGVRSEILSAVEEPSGRLWLSSENDGLVSVDDSGPRRYGLSDGLPSQRITQISGGANGSLWIGSQDAGLIHFADGKFRTLNQRAGLGDDSVCGIVPDGAGGLWLTSIQGHVARVREADALAFFSGSIPQIPVLRFSGKDELPANGSSWRCTLGALGRDGRIWMGLSRGAVVFERPQDATLPPPITAIIDRIRLGGQDVTPNDGGRIWAPSSRNTLEVLYTSALFDGRQHLRFKYRLDGFDGSWREGSEGQEAYYGRLGAGAYRFRVAAFFKDEPAMSDLREASFAFVLVAPFHQTRTFYGILFGAAGLGLVLALRLRAVLVRRRLAVITDERNRIAREIHDSLEQTLFAAKLQLEAGNPQRGGELVERSIEETRAAVWALRTGIFGRTDLASAVSITAGETLRGTRVSFSVETQGTPYRLAAVAEWHIGQSIREAMTNALKHGKPTRLQVKLEFAPDRLSACIIDDGVGMSPQILAGETQAGHYGLTNMRERLRAFGGSVTLHSSPGQGSTVRLEVPRV